MTPAPSPRGTPVGGMVDISNGRTKAVDTLPTIEGLTKAATRALQKSIDDAKKRPATDEGAGR